MFHKKIESFPVDVIRSLLRDKDHRGHAVSEVQLEALRKKEIDTLSCFVNGCRRGLAVHPSLLGDRNLIPITCLIPMGWLRLVGSSK